MSANVSLRNANESTASPSVVLLAGRSVAAESRPGRPLGLVVELTYARPSAEKRPVGSTATIVARASSAWLSASFASARKFQSPRDE